MNNYNALSPQKTAIYPKLNKSDWDRFVSETENFDLKMRRLKKQKALMPMGEKLQPSVHDFADLNLYIKKANFSAIKSWIDIFGLDVKNDRQENILHMVIMSGQEEILEQLLGLDGVKGLLTQKDCSGDLPIDVAHDEKSWNLAILLVRQGSTVNTHPDKLLSLVKKAPISYLNLLDDLNIKPYEKLLAIDFRHTGAHHSKEVSELLKVRGEQSWAKKLDRETESPRKRKLVV